MTDHQPTLFDLPELEWPLNTAVGKYMTGEGWSWDAHLQIWYRYDDLGADEATMTDAWNLFWNSDGVPF